jgi:hypothetical protein
MPGCQVRVTPFMLAKAEVRNGSSRAQARMGGRGGSGGSSCGRHCQRHLVAQTVSGVSEESAIMAKVAAAGERHCAPKGGYAARESRLI